MQQAEFHAELKTLAALDEEQRSAVSLVAGRSTDDERQNLMAELRKLNAQELSEEEDAKIPLQELQTLLLGAHHKITQQDRSLKEEKDRDTETAVIDHLFDEPDAHV